MDNAYKITCELETAIIGILQNNMPGYSHAEVKDLFYEWLEDEGGNMAIFTLAAMVIY